MLEINGFSIRRRARKYFGSSMVWPGKTTFNDVILYLTVENRTSMQPISMLFDQNDHIVKLFFFFNIVRIHKN